jgi:PAS domain S-box-containing protein
MNTTSQKFHVPQSKEQTILVIDDNPANLETVTDCLAEYGFEVLVARSGETGVERARLVHPDLILLDVIMPGMDGFEVCQHLKADAATQEIPIVFMTALVETEQKVRGFQVGAVDYITKPFQREEVLARVLTHLRIRELNERLEQKVRERTDELAQAVEEAQQLNEQLTCEIAERAQTEAALRESEDRFRRLAENAKDMIYRMTLPDGRYEYISPASSDLLGYSPDEFYNSPRLATDIIHPDWRGYFEEQWANLIAGDMSPSYEYQIVHKSGAVKWLHQRNVLIRNDSGTPIAIEGIVTDITERKQAEDGQLQALAEALKATHALQESEERFRTLVEQSPLAIEIFDPDGVLRQVNKAWERLWSANAQDAVGKYNALENEQLQQSSVFPLLERLFAGESVKLPDTEFDPTASGLPGRKRWVRGHTYHIKDKDDQVQHIVLMHEDITEHKQAEEEREQLLAQIQEQAQRMQQIMDTVPEGVLLLNADGQVTLANPVAERDLLVLTGARVGDTITHLGNRLLAELLTSPPKGLWHEVKTNAPHENEERTFEIIARPMAKDPEPEDWVLVIRDVTQQREFEHRIQRQERLAAVGQLAAGIAHDFNNIVATIVLYAQMTARMQDLPDRVHERMLTINQQAQHATNLIRQILDFSRRSPLERRPFDLLPFLKEQVKMLERILPESIAIKLHHGPDEYTINADPTRMQQMVTNLAVNARDAMPEGGEFHIELKRIEIKYRREAPLPEMPTGEWVQVTVSDTGTGIPPDALPHIFDPFFTTKESDKGSGLGLAQVHGIVGQHGGHITVDTRRSKGTTFTIYLPTLPAHPSELSALERESFPKGQGETILIIEDNAAAREALGESLVLLNYRVMEARNGQEGLVILEQHSAEIALVLSDVVMPKMGGIALFHALKEQGLKVPMVMMTGHPMEKELDNLQAQGLSGWLLKPTNLEELAIALSQALKEASSQ